MTVDRSGPACCPWPASRGRVWSSCTCSAWLTSSGGPSSCTGKCRLSTCPAVLTLSSLLRVKYVKSWRGENLGLAKFEGVYLPLLWDSSFCYRSPLALGYTRGHFCALVPPEPCQVSPCGGAGGGAEPPSSESQHARKSAFLPLMTKDR